jgi:GT2 family glycosyltransferase
MGMDGELLYDHGLKSTAKQLRVAIGIATAGRADILLQTVGLFKQQRRPANSIFVCAPSEADIAGLREAHPEVICLLAPKGLPHQRNQLMDAAADIDVLLFLDDDFVMAPDYLAEMEAAFLEHSDVVMTTGRVVADGITGPGLTIKDAELRLAVPRPLPSVPLSVVYNGYGCNMAVRMAVARKQRLRFDEELPLYAWLEDVDFSRSMAPFGWIVRIEKACGVHLGTKSGRQPGVRLGYSQIANPCYLIAKGTCSWQMGLLQMGRNLAANIYGTLRGEKDIDRSGRLRGNAKAMIDLAMQRLTPARALQLS